MKPGSCRTRPAFHHKLYGLWHLQTRDAQVMQIEQVYARAFTQRSVLLWNPQTQLNCQGTLLDYCSIIYPRCKGIPDHSCLFLASHSVNVCYTLLCNRKLHFGDVLGWVHMLSMPETNLTGCPNDLISVVFQPGVEDCVCPT
jgi:hypothetical protein